MSHVYKYKDFITLAKDWVISSVGLEHYLDRVGVGSSNLPSPTRLNKGLYNY